MEDFIIGRAKFLINFQQMNTREAIRQAINEKGGYAKLNDTYLLYDVTIEDYIDYIERKIKGDLKWIFCYFF